MTQEKYGELTIISDAPRRYGMRRVNVRCVCGVEKVVNFARLRDGETKSCGCMKSAFMSAGLTVHGHCSGRKQTPEYAIWTDMKKRCAGGTKSTVHIYAGRGIYVCARWSEDFSAFFGDMGARPSPLHSIDRVNNDGSYTCGKCDDCIARGAPANCRWATDGEQNRNTRRTILITHNGETMCAKDWAARLGVHSTSLREAIKRGVPFADYAARHGL